MRTTTEKDRVINTLVVAGVVGLVAFVVGVILGRTLIIDVTPAPTPPLSVQMPRLSQHDEQSKDWYVYSLLAVAKESETAHRMAKLVWWGYEVPDGQGGVISMEGLLKRGLIIPVHLAPAQVRSSVWPVTYNEATVFVIGPTYSDETRAPPRFESGKRPASEDLVRGIWLSMAAEAYLHVADVRNESGTPYELNPFAYGVRVGWEVLQEVWISRQGPQKPLETVSDEEMLRELGVGEKDGFTRELLLALKRVGTEMNGGPPEENLGLWEQRHKELCKTLRIPDPYGRQ